MTDKDKHPPAAAIAAGQARQPPTLEQAKAHQEAAEKQNREMNEAREANQIPPDQLVTPPAGTPLVGGKQVHVLIGPYVGHVLTMPEAEADKAVADKWAKLPEWPPFDASKDLPPPLTDAEQAAALDAANKWAADQQPHPEHPGPVDERRDSTRALQAEPDHPYETRGGPPKRR